MNSTLILNVSEKRGCFSHKLQCEKYENISVITIANRKRALKKLSKILQNEKVIINNHSKDECIFENRIKEYNKLSYKTVFPVINKICRCTASKYSMQLPFEEVYILANPTTAYSIIAQLIGISRMFTIVSQENAGKEADELYFEHGCVIRHIRKADRKINRDSIVIRLDNTTDLSFDASPVINIADTSALGNKVINARSICVYDNRLSTLCNLWGGNSGLLLYNLFEEFPAENTKVDINKNADRIFLLDTKQF